MNKYYTPSIEEFHIGFEYEWLDEAGIWIKETSPTEITPIGFDEQTYGLRVKYLDKEDIESLGLTLKYSDSSLYVKDLYNLYFEKDNKICILQTKDRPHILFDGTIKNKSELKILLKWIGVLE